MSAKSDGDNRWGEVPKDKDDNIITDKELFSIAAEREPFTVYKAEDKILMKEALVKLIPDYAERDNVAASILLCNRNVIEDNIKNADKDTLFTAFKALNYYLNTSNDSAILNPVKEQVTRQLKLILSNEINITEGEQLCS